MISVRRLSAENFLCYKSVDVVLPRKGIVVVTGDNGSGKSTLIEIMSAALWSRLLRGTKWSPKMESSLMVETSELSVSRMRKGSKRQLSWTLSDGTDGAKHATETKAQAALTEIVGTYDQWRRSCVFSSSDLSTFSRATDAERKRLLEEMIGIDIFDSALSSCRKDLSKVKRSLALAEADNRVLDARLFERRRQVDMSKDDIGPEPDRPSKAKHAALIEEKDRVFQEYRKLESEVHNVKVALHAARRDVDRCVAEMKTSAANPKCSKCGQKLSDDMVRRISDDVEKARSEASDKVTSSEQKLVALEKWRDASLMESERVVNDLRECERAVAVHDKWMELKHFRDEKLAGIKSDLARLADECLVLDDVVDEHAADVSMLSVVEDVLGVQGVRSRIMHRCLVGLQEVANVWISRLLPGVSITLNAETPLARGGTADKISIEVSGLCHNSGYLDCSGGERRRIDIALLLGLAEMQAGASGGAAGTLFLDEVLDTLDDAGVVAVCDALHDVSADRCVVVVSHNSKLVATLDAVQRMHCCNGTIDVI